MAQRPSKGVSQSAAQQAYTGFRGIVPAAVGGASDSGMTLMTGADGVAEWSFTATPYYAGMYLDTTGAPTHTSSGNWQKVGDGGGTETWVSLCDVRPTGVSAQVDVATNKRIDIRRGGIYLVSFGVAFASLADGLVVAANLYVNGASRIFSQPGRNGGTGFHSADRTSLVSLASGDYLELYAFQNDTASEGYYVAGGQVNFIQATYIGPAS